MRLFYRGEGVIDAQRPEFSGSVSVWLRTSPDEDLPRAYCDPVMILSDDHRKGFLFLEWSREGTPRRFRYAIVPETSRWDPGAREWDMIPDPERPMVQLGHRPFSRDRWVHVVFTFDRINAGRNASGRLYIDGEPAGEITGWDLTFAWDPANVILALAWSYVGLVDDLAVFDRALTEQEVRVLGRLPQGVRALYEPPASQG